MRHLPADKYNVAWFKLAEFVCRGERERAFGLYRLLVHSFNDAALAVQLEGDLCLSFSDVPAALICYEKAAVLYEQDRRLIQAAAMYEHMLTLVPYTASYVVKLVTMHESLGHSFLLAQAVGTLAALHVINQQSQEAEGLIVYYQSVLPLELCVALYQHCIHTLIVHTADEQFIKQYIHVWCDSLMQATDQQLLHQCLVRLELASPQWHNYALQHLTTATDVELT